MEQNWKAHLESKGAVINENTVIHYGDPESELKNLYSANKTVIVDLSNYGLIKISGSDTQSFLQSQFSNDVDLITNSQAQLNSYCSPKGRVLALFNLFQVNKDYYLHLPLSLLDSTLKRLTMFKMRADVELMDVSDTVKCIGIAGLSAESLLKNKYNSVPATNYNCLTLNNSSNEAITILRISNETHNQIQPRFLVFANLDSIISLWNENSENLLAVGYGLWSLLDIRSGIPSITSKTVETFVPQMLNLQLINAVSFQKGCYPGQEIVARTQYLGKLKKRLYLMTSDYNEILEPGTDLSTENASDDQSKGKIVNCQLNPNGGIDALAVLQINCINEGNIIVKSAPTIEFSIQELPYSFEEVE